MDLLVACGDSVRHSVVGTLVSREMRAMSQDKINPEHYNGDECMHVIARWTRGLDGSLAFCIGQAVKYLWRAGDKPGESSQDDRMKAQWYLRWMWHNAIRPDPNILERRALMLSHILLGVAIDETMVPSERREYLRHTKV